MCPRDESDLASGQKRPVVLHRPPPAKVSSTEQGKLGSYLLLLEILLSVGSLKWACCVGVVLVDSTVLFTGGLIPFNKQYE